MGTEHFDQLPKKTSTKSAFMQRFVGTYLSFALLPWGCSLLFSCGSKSKATVVKTTEKKPEPTDVPSDKASGPVASPTPVKLPPDSKLWFQDLGGLGQETSFQLKELENQKGWKQLQVGGGGYITGLYVHPLDPDRPWIRTDISGVLKWDPSQKTWVKKFLAWPIAKSNHYGVEGLALDPGDPKVIYLALGKYSANWAGNGVMVKSTDGGETWQELAGAPALRMGGNEFLRFGGERLVVDSKNPNTILFAPRSNSNASPALAQPQLLRSTDGGQTWASLTVDSNGLGQYGLTSIVPASDVAGHFFAASYGKAVYETTNNGDTWTDINSPNTFVHRLMVNGKSLWATGRSADPADSSVQKSSLTRFCFATDSVCLSTGWTNLSPPHVAPFPEGLATVAVHPSNRNILLAARASSTHSSSTGLLSTVFVSTNSGQNWKSYQPRLEFQHGWLGGSNRYADHVSQIAFLANGDFWLADWYGTWKHRQEPANSYPVAQQQVRGLENTVVFDVHPGPDSADSSMGGVQLEVLTGMADVDGFPHLRASSFPPSKHLMESGYNMQATLSFAEALDNPSILARVSGNMWSNSGYGNIPILMSSNGGLTWRTTVMPNDPNRGPPANQWDESVRVRAARVAFASKDGQKMIMLGFNAGVWTTSDQGLNWTKNLDLPLWNPGAGFFSFARPLLTDPLRPETVYYYQDVSGHQAGSFWVSQDSGLNFSRVQDGNSSTTSSIPHNGRAQLVALKRAGAQSSALALATRTALHLSFNQGSTWTGVPGVLRADLVAAGAPKHPGEPQTLWIAGSMVNRGEGLFYSTNEGSSWEKVGWEQTDGSNEPTVLQARKDKFGVLYLGTNGSGAWRFVAP